jgi:uncharacterized phage-like protein YoqJ
MEKLNFENAKNLYLANKLLKKFENPRTEKTNFAASYDFFKKHYFDDLAFYKQDKKSGYSCLALYKNVALVGIGDFMTSTGKTIKESHPETKTWENNSLRNYKKAILKAIYGDDIYDNRYRSPVVYKQKAEKMWEKIAPILFEE